MDPVGRVVHPTRVAQSPFVGSPEAAPPEPAEQVSLQPEAAPAPEHKKRMLWRIASGAAMGIGLAGMAVTLTGCGEPPPTTVTQSTQGDPIDVTQATQQSDFLQLQVDPMSHARIDIHRETTTDSDNHEENVDLSPYGITLGNGLFLDANGNLTFNPFIALHGQPLGDAHTVGIHSWGSNDATITHDGTGDETYHTFGSTAHIHGGQLDRTWGPSVTLTRSGNTVSVDRGFFNNAWRITQNGNQTVIQRGFLNNTWTITRDGNRITIDQGALTSKVSIDLYQHGAVVHRGFLQNDVTARETGNDLHIDPGPLTNKIDVTSQPGQVTVHTPLSPDQTLSAQN